MKESFIFQNEPVMGASTSIIVFSCRSNLPPSSMIFNATSSVTRPSFMKWVFKRSTRGFPRASKTSCAVKRVPGGDGMARIPEKTHSITKVSILLFITRSVVGMGIVAVSVEEEDGGDDDKFVVLVDVEVFEALVELLGLLAIGFLSGR